MMQPMEKVALETFDYDITRYWLGQTGILVITTGNAANKHEITDEWTRVVKLSVDSWPSGQPIRVLYDSSFAGLSFTEYSRRKALEAYGYYPKEQVSHLGILLPKGFISMFITNFVNFNNRRQTHVVMKASTNWDTLLEWLQSKG